MKFSIEKVKFLTKKHSPEIWLGAGIVAIIGGVVWACNKSRDLNQLLEIHQEDCQLVKEEKKESIIAIIEHSEDGIITNTNYSDDDLKDAVSTFKDKDKAAYKLVVKQHRSELVKCYALTAGELVRMYVPAVILIGGGIGMIVYGHQILNKRNAALISAYATLEEAFNKYRLNVRERYGEQIEDDIFNGRRYKEVTTTAEDDNGKKKKVKEQVAEIGTAISPYSRFFDEENTKEWFKSFSTNWTFLKSVQNMANNKLISDGFLLLNEVYDMLGLKPSSTGAICGWILPKEGETEEGDSYVDFGIIADEEHNRFLLNFNCQGMIYDKIG